MKKLMNLAVFTLFFGLGAVLFSLTANAYIDPSAMTYIVQILVGIVIAGGAAFAFYFKRISRWFQRKFKKNGTAVEEANVPGNDDLNEADEFDEFDDEDE